MIDKVTFYLHVLDRECEILPKDKWEYRHQYLGKGESTNYKHDLNEYMPNIYLNVWKESKTIYSIKIDVCPSKILYGHNLQEISSNELEVFLDKLVEKLNYAGIITNKEILRKKPLSCLDVNKLVILPLSKNSFKMLSQNTIEKGRFEKSVTIYPEKGEMIVNSLKHRKLTIYDKSAQSEHLKFAPKELKDLLEKAPFTLINIEYRIQGKDEIEAEFKTHKIQTPNTLENAFNPIIAQTILKSRASEFLDKLFTIDISDTDKILSMVSDYCINNGISGPQKRSGLLGGIIGIGTLGFEKYRKYILADSDKKTALSYIKEIQKIGLPNLPEEKSLKDIIFKSLETMTPITVESLKIANDRLRRGIFPPQSGSITRTASEQAATSKEGGIK